MARLEVVFLGSGGSIPTENRNHPAVAIRYQGWNLLFDAGEDVQRQFERARLGNNKHMVIFISHMHADHILGLPGLLLRFSLLGRIRPLQIFGPKELIEYVRINQDTIHLGTTFETTVYAIEAGPIIEIDDIKVSAFEVNHRGYALGYEILYQRPRGHFIPQLASELGVPKGPLWKDLALGKSVKLDDGRTIRPEEVTDTPPPPIKIVYTGDTRPCETLRQVSQNATLLISEAMYCTSHAELAEERGHMTAAQAAELARDAGVKYLALTHYSPRYGNGLEILKEAQHIFKNSILAHDLMRLEIDKEGVVKRSNTSNMSACDNIA